MPGADHGGVGQPCRDLVRVEQVWGRAGGGRARWLAAGWVGKSPDGQLDVVPELLVQFFSGGGGPRRQPDREGGCLPSSPGHSAGLRGHGAGARLGQVQWVHHDDDVPRTRADQDG